MIRRPTPHFLPIFAGVILVAVVVVLLSTAYMAAWNMPPNTLYFHGWVRMETWGSAARTPDGRWWFKPTFSCNYQEVLP